MSEKNHIFIYILNRSDDPFVGIKDLIRSRCHGGKIVDIRLDPKDYDCIRKVEYTWRRYVRVFYYWRIFRHLSKMISGALREGSKNVVYMADEGLWGVFLNSKLYKTQIPYTTVNVQHGFFDIGSGKLKKYFFRRLINTVTIPALGGPLFGYGFGGGGFNIYVCYGQEEANWLRRAGHEKVYPCPELIKFGFIKRYRVLKETRDISKAVFILPASVPGSSFRCRLPEFLRLIAPLVEYLVNERQFSVTLRPHPGGDLGKDRKMILDSPVGRLVNVDEEVDIAGTLATHPLVMSAHSTALFEAQIVGRCAVAISTPCYDRPIHYLYRTIDLMSSDWKKRLDSYLDSYSNEMGAFPKMDLESLCPPDLIDQIFSG